jgi:hypothetical protein
VSDDFAKLMHETLEMCRIYIAETTSKLERLNVRKLHLLRLIAVLEGRVPIDHRKPSWRNAKKEPSR